MVFLFKKAWMLKMKKLLVVDLKEIRAVRWVCDFCKTHVEFPISQEKAHQIIFDTAQCPVCKEDVGSEKSGPISLFNKFKENIKNVVDKDIPLSFVIDRDVT